MNETPNEAVPQGRTGIVDALMNELGGLLRAFLATGRRGSVDLLRLALSEAALAELERRLGRGELAMSFEAAGMSRIHETAWAGLWMVEHRDREDRVVARLVEAGDVPDIVRADAVDMRASVAALAPHDVGARAGAHVGARADLAGRGVA